MRPHDTASPETVRTRRCSACKETKPLHEFSRCKSQPLGYTYYCLPCSRVRRKLYPKSEEARQYRRKPEIIEAEQWFPGKEMPGVVMKPNWIGGKGHGRIDLPPQPYFEEGNFSSPLYPGDYITKTEAGRGVARRGYFESLYEPITDD